LERIEKIESTVSRISSIIRGLQNFSRSGDSLPKRLCALSTIVTTVLDFCSQKFKHHNIELRLSPCPAVEVAVVQIQIEQVLVNLLSNSFDAVVDLKERWVAITYEVTSEAVSILVTDSGTGLPAHVASRITEPFFTTKPVGQGTGLGLSICKGIMESHGGELHYDRESANTRFRIVIPNPSIIQTPVAITPDAISPSEKTRVTHIKQSS
jgi:C4-dicarboxylate-specific signal transduction histidine kinase